ncbi:MAG: lysophospholipase [Firmicutes bacterium]|nr:lysophospholipase [Bacillota bacterium]
MPVKKFRFDASNGEHQIQAVLWTPDGGGEPRGVLQIAHGMHEYGERYSEFAGFMTARGYAVCANDHAGHGDSYKDANLRGYFGAKNGYLHMVGDMRELMRLVRAEFPERAGEPGRGGGPPAEAPARQGAARPGLPYFLLGHSMGSFLARYFCSLYGDELSGAIFSGTGNGPAVLPLGVLLCRAQVRLFGATYRSKGGAMYRLSRSAYLKRFVPVRTGAEWLTRDEKKALESRDDPRSKFIFTAGGNLDLLRVLNRVSSPKWAAKIPAGLPVLLFSGSEDPVGHNGKDVRKVYSWLKAAGCKDVTVKIYEGGRHEMLNEINRAEVFEDVAGWIEKRT